MRFYFVRHGETDWNKHRMFQGHTDIPLNENGKKQVQWAAQYLSDKKIEAVYTSDLARAHETAQIIAGAHGLKPIKDDRLREVNFGEWEGLSFNEISAKHKEALDAWLDDIIGTQLPGGGKIEDVLRNLVSFINDMISINYQELVVATHGGVIKTLIWHVNEGSVVLWEQEIFLGSITILDYDLDDQIFTLSEVNIVP